MGNYSSKNISVLKEAQNHMITPVNGCMGKPRPWGRSTLYAIKHCCWQCHVRKRRSFVQTGYNPLNASLPALMFLWHDGFPPQRKEWPAEWGKSTAQAHHSTPWLLSILLPPWVESHPSFFLTSPWVPCHGDFAVSAGKFQALFRRWYICRTHTSNQIFKSSFFNK